MVRDDIAGKIIEIRGRQVLATFEPPLPAPGTQLMAGQDRGVLVEVVRHVDPTTVSGVALMPARRLRRGEPIEPILMSALFAV